MGGWYPERLPVLLAMFDFEHVDGLPEMLVAIRNEMIKTEAENG